MSLLVEVKDGFCFVCDGARIDLFFKSPYNISEVRVDELHSVKLILVGETVGTRVELDNQPYDAVESVPVECERGFVIVAPLLLLI